VKVTPNIAKNALASGGRQKREVQPPPPAPEKPPENAPQEALTGAIGELVAELKEQVNAAQAQLQASQEQAKALGSMVAALSAEKPVRLKVTRDMNRESPTYLLLQHIDVVPVTYKKLN